MMTLVLKTEIQYISITHKWSFLEVSVINTHSKVFLLITCFEEISLTNNRMGRGGLGPGGVWGRVQGVGSDHWSTRSQP